MNFDLINQHLAEPPETCLDIGANIGGWYQEAREAWPSCSFILVEGNPECEPVLAFLGADYRIALLSDDGQPREFFTHPEHPTWTGAGLYPENSQWGKDSVATMTATTTLNDLLPDYRPQFIKIDCQGGELDILAGGDTLLEDARAVLLEVAVSDWNPGAPCRGEVFHYMKMCGYTRHVEIEEVHEPGGRHVQSDVLFLT